MANDSSVLALTEHRIDEALVLRAAVHGATALNVIDQDIMLAARAEFVDLLARPGLRCVLLTGATARAFIGGANLHALRTLNSDTAETFIRSVHDFCAALRLAPVPVIAVMRGHCLGAGLEIAASCDLRIGDYSVRAGMPEVRVGVPSVIEAALLPSLIGWGKARELLLRGHIIAAEEAHRIGLLQHLVDPAELDDLALTIARDIVAAAPGALATQKQLFVQWQDSSSMSAAIEHGVQAFIGTYATSSEPAIYAARFFAGRTPRNN